MAKPTKRISYAKWLQEKQKAKRGENNGVADTLVNPATKAELEQVIGRTLTNAEAFFERMDRDGDGGIPYDRIREWKPKMKSDDSDLPFATEIAEAKKQVEAAKVLRMSAVELELHNLLKMQAEQVAQKKLTDDHNAWLADPKTKATLERLKTLDSETAFDSNWNWDETVSIARAIHSFETVGADTDAANALADEVFNIDKTKRLAAMSEVEQQREAILTELQLKTAELTALGYIEKKPDGQQQPPTDAETQLRELKVTTALFEAAKGKASSENSARVLAEYLARKAKYDDSGNAVIELDNQSFTPADAIAHVAGQTDKFGSLFNASVPVALPISKNGTERPTEFDWGKATIDDVRSRAGSDELVQAALK